MGEAQGKKVDPSAVAAQAIEAQPPFGQIKPGRARCSRAQNSILGRRHGGHRPVRARGPGFQAKKGKRWRTERTTPCLRTGGGRRPYHGPRRLGRARRRLPLNRNAPARAAIRPGHQGRSNVCPTVDPRDDEGPHLPAPGLRHPREAGWTGRGDPSNNGRGQKRFARPTYAFDDHLAATANTCGETGSVSILLTEIGVTTHAGSN